eukprot:tig00000325_g24085.t1
MFDDARGCTSCPLPPDASEAALRKRVSALSLSLAEASTSCELEADPPTGDVSLVLTDIQGSSKQWEACPDAFAHALCIHNKIMRLQSHRHRGYAVKTEGDSFLFAFNDVVDAALFCCDVQTDLLCADWPEDILKLPDSAVVPATSTEGGLADELEAARFVGMECETILESGVVFRGLRVRMGLHTGPARAQRDPTTKRMDYVGPAVNRVARIAALAQGGQILAPRACIAEEGGTLGRRAPPILTPVGTFTLRGMESNGPEEICQISPPRMRRRRFADPHTNAFRRLCERDAILHYLMESIVSRMESRRLSIDVGHFVGELAALSSHLEGSLGALLAGEGAGAGEAARAAN